MKIVGVTACSTGIAHTFMAAERLEKAAKNLGYSIRIETQAAVGIENELSQAEIDVASVAILAADVPVEGEHRFDQIRKLKVPILAALKDPGAIFAQLETFMRGQHVFDASAIVVPSRRRLASAR